jgi:hypothetical protein
MLKKIIVASAIFAFFACSGEDGDSNTPNSSSSQGSAGGDVSSSSLEPSSSSEGAVSVLISNLGTAGGKSPLFNTYPYGYTLKENSDEDLTQFWNCPPEQSTMTVAEINACRLPQTDAILQNWLTTRDSPLHYIINNMTTANPVQNAIKLNSYNLTKAGDQAALGLNVSDDGKSIEDAGISNLNGTVAFTYFYAGGAHKFRIAVNDADFWYADVPAQAAEGLVTINASDLKGMGSFAADETPFEIGKVTKFLWVVEFDAQTPANNTGSLLVYLFNALIEK